MEDWARLLLEDQTEAAWDRFLGRYRRLIFAAIRHYLRDPDDVMDVFTRVLEALRDRDFRRLRSFVEDPSHSARFSTWLVTVVRHQAIDWIRLRDGRDRLPASAQSLPPLERRVFELVLVQGAAHIEAFERLRTGELPTLSYREYLAALRAAYRAAGRGIHRGPAVEPEPPAESPEPAVILEEEGTRRRQLLSAALAALPPEDQTLLQLYVVEGMAADAVSRVVGLPNAKAVYNRAYRAMALIRPMLEQAGLRPGEG